MTIGSRMRHHAWAWLAAMVLVGVVHADASAGATSVNVSVDGKPAMAVDAAALAAMPHEQVTASAHDEPSSTWRGVPLEAILAKAGVPLDKPLRGKSLSAIVRVTASDQYQVVFALSDLDPTLGHVQVLLVDTRDGKPLDKDGPYRLLVPGDKRPARWVRNVASIEVVSASTTNRP